MERSSVNWAPRVRLRAGTLLFEVIAPEAPRIWDPAGSDGIKSIAVQTPSAVAEIPVATGAWSTVTMMAVSLAPNPTPLAVTEAPGAVLGRSTETNGVTVKVACADCREESVIPIDLGPPGTNGTWMEAETAPNELAEIERRVLPSKVMLAELLAPKPVPVTSTMVFGGPETVLMGMADVTVKNCVGALPTVIE